MAYLFFLLVMLAIARFGPVKSGLPLFAAALFGWGILIGGIVFLVWMVNGYFFGTRKSTRDPEK